MSVKDDIENAGNYFTTEWLEKCMEDIFDDGSDKRKIILRTGKGGALNWYEAVWTQQGMPQKQLEESLRLMDEKLEDGLYIIDQDGCRKE